MVSDSACGIVCEFDPFHNGHAYLIDTVKQTLGLPVVCAMSGTFTQRGEPALFDKAFRAGQAIAGGASAVLEIPFPYCASGAERFAEAGVKILTESGLCSHMAFGSESGDLPLLWSIADYLLRPQTVSDIRARQKCDPTLSYAAARTQSVRDALGTSAEARLRLPNDILAVEYLKAIRKRKSPLIPLAVRRTAAHGGGIAGHTASSSVIRELLLSEREAASLGYLPEGTVLPPVDRTAKRRLDEMLFLSLPVKTPADLAGIAEIPHGAENRILRAARESRSYAELTEKLRSKAFTDAKIRRMLLFAFFGVTRERLSEPVAYTSLLARREDAGTAALLKRARGQAIMPVASRASGAKKDKTAAGQYDFNCRAETYMQTLARTCL